jgi:hypothetical protein
MAEEEIVFPAKKAPAVAAIAIVFGAVALWVLRQSNGLGRFSDGLMSFLVVATCLAVWAGGRHRVVFAGKTLRVLSGSKATAEIDLARVTRLILRRKLVGRVFYVSYFGVLPEREAELFDKVNYPDVPRILHPPGGTHRPQNRGITHLSSLLMLLSDRCCFLNRNCA